MAPIINYYLWKDSTQIYCLKTAQIQTSWLMTNQLIRNRSGFYTVCKKIFLLSYTASTGNPSCSQMPECIDNMICCDNRKCRTWFHRKCLNIDSQRNEWQCPSCEIQNDWILIWIRVWTNYVSNSQTTVASLLIRNGK